MGALEAASFVVFGLPQCRGGSWIRLGFTWCFFCIWLCEIMSRIARLQNNKSRLFFGVWQSLAVGACSLALALVLSLLLSIVYGSTFCTVVVCVQGYYNGPHLIVTSTGQKDCLLIGLSMSVCIRCTICVLLNMAIAHPPHPHPHCWKYETQFYWCVKFFLSHGKECLGKSCHSSQPTSMFKVVPGRFVHSIRLTNKLIVVSIICVL